jgi:hypothetical protein
MDQESLLKSIEKHLDSLESSLNWSLLLILAVIWYGLQRLDINQILDLVVLKVSRQYSYLILGLILSFFHIGSLSELMSKEDLAWYLGSRLLMTFFSLLVGLLIFFICNSYKGTL